MKDNFIHVCFVIDKSGSMYNCSSDITSGFKKVIDEQKANTNGTCSVSLFEFDGKVKEVFKGIDINKIDDFKYDTGGNTALYDGIGTAIDSIGSWLNSMDENEKPEQNLIVIMTDGFENSSMEYTKEKVKKMIKEQEEKYSWKFIYMGSDINSSDDANSLGFSTRVFNSKKDLNKNYNIVTSYLSAYRNSGDSLFEKRTICDRVLQDECIEVTKTYAKDNNLSIDDLINKK